MSFPLLYSIHNWFASRYQYCQYCIGAVLLFAGTCYSWVYIDKWLWTTSQVPRSGVCNSTHVCRLSSWALAPQAALEAKKSRQHSHWWSQLQIWYKSIYALSSLHSLKTCCCATFHVSFTYHSFNAQNSLQSISWTFLMWPQYYKLPLGLVGPLVDPQYKFFKIQTNGKNFQLTSRLAALSWKVKNTGTI